MQIRTSVKCFLAPVITSFQKEAGASENELDQGGKAIFYSAFLLKGGEFFCF